MINMNEVLNKLLSNLDILHRAERMAKALSGYYPSAFVFEVIRQVRLTLSFRTIRINDKQYIANEDRVIELLGSILNEYASLLKDTVEYDKLLLPHSKHTCIEHIMNICDCDDCDDMRCSMRGKTFCDVCGRILIRSKDK